MYSLQGGSSLTPAHVIEKRVMFQKPEPPKRPNTPKLPRKDASRKQAMNMRHWKPKPQPPNTERT